MANAWIWEGEEEWLSLLGAKKISQQPLVAEEERLRYRATGYINQICHQLKIPRNSILIAQMMLHRFYCRKSFEEYHYEEISCAIIFLVMKIEHSKVISIKENLLPLLSSPSSSPSPSSDLHNNHPVDGEERILELENCLLRVLCFDFSFIQPIPLLLKCIGELGIDALPDGDDIIMEAMTHFKDAYRTILPVRVLTLDLAKSSIFYAIRKRNNVMINVKTNKLVVRILDKLYSPESSETIRRK